MMADETRKVEQEGTENMNFEELSEKLGGTESASDWKQAQGGGWLHKSAQVYDDTKITGNAIVWGKVSDNAQVSDNAWVYGNAQVSGNAKVSGGAWVYGGAQVSDNAQVSGNAKVYGDARVSGDAWVKSPLFIIGSRFSLTNCKKGHIQIGCECHTFDWWKKHGNALAKAHNFTPEEIAEYTAYINLFCEVGQ
jgi:hypothetical protein